ncbi:hypothetical protein FVEG_08616 [Fusarium verticillioides 7600]|uniref:AAA+ ATPase lid domain-containing protein n=1 Tax=Gibberella moniliformis (strain M3125 / FGSC 7600) TaxID=334819 RepID=W7MMK0_GIBM7|nr:hypothetical protein FVEG_08616 [Fusarium verticillioides 7600]EWG48984.1 hypothetical protein FVEG_08616 [Fusarium verticillioides 7600]
MSFRGPRSRPRQEEGGGLNNFRVLDQSQPDPVNTPDLPQSSRTFRVAAFVFHLGMSMLESRRGREALRAFDRRAQETFIPKSNLQTDLNEARRFVDTFLAKCRAKPPNIIISDRITGEGLAQRVDWPSILGSQIGDYNPKWAAMFRLNKAVVDSAVSAAELQDIRALQKMLFLLSISVAHELFHMLMGFMFGDSERLTPPVINHSPGTPRGPRAGESGRYWEAKFFGCVVKAHHDPRDPRGSNQAGIFFGTLDGRRSFSMQHQIILRYVQLDFTVPTFSSNIATSSLNEGRIETSLETGWYQTTPSSHAYTSQSDTRALDEETRRKVWTGLFRKLVRKRAGKVQITPDAKKWVLGTAGETSLNGRDIRNALQTAITLAEFESEEDPEYDAALVIVVAKAHFQKVLEMCNRFRSYVTSIRREDEMKRAQGRGDRNDYGNEFGRMC